MPDSYNNYEALYYGNELDNLFTTRIPDFDPTIYAGAGNDTIKAWEHSSYSNAHNFYGEEGDDVLIGSDNGENYLDGGRGEDHMTGGKRDDTYVVDNINDVIVEPGAAVGEVFENLGDTVISSIDFALTETDNLENLTIIGNDSGITTGLGDKFDNVMSGGEGAHLEGREGDDIYNLTNGGSMFEASGEGFDVVKFSVGHSESAAAVIQNYGEIEQFVAELEHRGVLNVTGTVGDDDIYIGNEVYKRLGRNGKVKYTYLSEETESIVNAGKGNDKLESVANQARYIFGLGDGHDEILTRGQEVTLVFEDDIKPEDLVMHIGANSHFIQMSGDQSINITLGSELDARGQPISGGINIVGYEFSEGVFSLEDMQTRANKVTHDPVAERDYVRALPNRTIIFNALLQNDVDADDDTLSITSATAENGAVAINSDGTVSYTSNSGFLGNDQITYHISDGHGGTSSSLVFVSVAEPNNRFVICS